MKTLYHITKHDQNPIGSLQQGSMWEIKIIFKYQSVYLPKKLYIDYFTIEEITS